MIATQNPIEHEGTYPLPDSQLDRFLMRISLGYPAPEDELTMLDTHGDGNPLADVEAVLTTAEVSGLTRAAAGVHVAPPLRQYLVQLADATRRHPQLELGMSPRATLALLQVIRGPGRDAGARLRRRRTT